MIPDVQLSARPIFFSDGGFQDPLMDGLETVTHPEYDIVIQHSLPSYLSRTGLAKKNMCFIPVETINNSGWSNYLNLMDNILVSTIAEKEALPDDLKSKALIVGGSLPGSLGDKSNIPSANFKFYFSGGSLEEKGGVKQLLEAYLSEFHVNENVVLTIHTTNAEKLNQLVGEAAQRVGKYTRSNYYPTIEIAHNCYAEEIHLTSDCTIDVGSTVNFRPDVAAGMSVGNPAIVVKGGAMEEFVTEDNGWLVESHEDVLICPDRPLADMFTARERCLVPHTVSIQERMRKAFEERRKCDNEDMFSMESRAELLRSILCT